MLKTHEAGSLRKSDIGKKVVLAGWIDRRRDHGGVAFFDLRDSSGIAQIVIHDEETVHKLRPEFVVRVEGIVELRPDGNENLAIPTGEIEINVEHIEILNTADVLPFQVAWGLESKEEISDKLRVEYRYLDLRTRREADILRLRSRVNAVTREYLNSIGFTEVETPTLIRSTPEGARDFLVPARLSPGSWYALPQSPQLYKQLLMVAGLEKYYQIARCYRDEDFRADRQPEFTQLDVELSFAEESDVMELGDEVLKRIWALIGHEIKTPIDKITYEDAMNFYGSDKPDLRFENRLVDLTDYFKATPFRVFQAPYVGAIVMKGGANQPRRQFDAWQEWARERGAKGLAYVIVSENGELTGPVAKNISETERNGLKEATSAENGDAIFFGAGERESAQTLLGMTRVEIARRQGILDDNEYAFVWVTDFPLFKEVGTDDDVAVGNSKWTAVHHAFTAPKQNEMATFDQNPATALSAGYDIVCNGNEIGGGSIRIHDGEVQKRVFKVMGIADEEADEKFGFLLKAFKFGAPPHGGVAMGWDRIVALLAKTQSIRDVIAFPKLGSGFDPMTKAPAPITIQQRREAGVDYKPKPAAKSDAPKQQSESATKE
ncbi:MAG: aspartate--tRNA ligase [Bifidobacteriaceae bacterium]|jgi:aspartyl-tRNA synthetase|nr:aspartate--tRNA ligase [Bifidobacteriaceae bacterium]